MKRSTCRDGTLKTNQTRWEWHNTFTPSLHLVPFSHNYAHHKTLYMHLAYSCTLNEQGTQHCSLHSLPSIHICHVHQQWISQHNLTLTYHDTDPVLLMYSVMTSQRASWWETFWWMKSNFLGFLPKSGKDQWDCEISNYYIAPPLQQ